MGIKTNIESDLVIKYKRYSAVYIEPVFVDVIDKYTKQGEYGTWHFAIGKRINGEGIPIYVMKEGDDYYISAFFDKGDNGEQYIKFRHPFGVSEQSMVYVTPVPEKWVEIWKESNGPLAQLYIHHVEDDRSRKYLYECVKDCKSFRMFSSLDDPGKKDGEEEILLGSGIDDYVVVRFEGSDDSTISLVQRAVKLISDAGPWRYYNGGTYHWIDTADDLSSRVSVLIHGYDGP
jgi:hypothetical protein